MKRYRQITVSKSNIAEMGSMINHVLREGSRALVEVSEEDKESVIIQWLEEVKEVGKETEETDA